MLKFYNNYSLLDGWRPKQGLICDHKSRSALADFGGGGSMDMYSQRCGTWGPMRSCFTTNAHIYNWYA